MPCDYSKYPPNWKTEIRPFILERAGHRCEICGAENYKPHPITGSKVVLTIMHLNHDTTDNRMENLKAGCQRCHNRYDSEYRKAHAAETRTRNQADAEAATGQMSLLQEATMKKGFYGDECQHCGEAGIELRCSVCGEYACQACADSDDWMGRCSHDWTKAESRPLGKDPDKAMEEARERKMERQHAS